MENKNCQNCKKDFTIEPEDLNFYQKIDVPLPTFCSECRMQRRMAWLNFSALYKRPCDLCKKEHISMYHPDASVTVYCPDCWWSDKWEGLEYGIDVDFSRPFLEQFHEQFKRIPLLSLSLNKDSIETSPYCNHAGSLKDCYLLFNSNHAEESGYSYMVTSSNNIYNSGMIMQSNWIFDCRNTFMSSRCVGGRGNIIECIDTYFCRDCTNCQDCFGCVNLKNKKYHIFNKPYSKDEYFQKISEYDLSTPLGYEKAQNDAMDFWKTISPKPIYIESSVNSSGNYIFNSKNARHCYDVTGVEDCAYIQSIYNIPVTDSYDITGFGEGLDLAYEGVIVGGKASNLKAVSECGYDIRNVEYSKLILNNSRDCFGSIALRGKQYCILNKQYPKDEYELLVQKIKQHMKEMPYIDKKGRVYQYGEFFPIEFSPFAYQDSLANNFIAYSEEQVTSNNYLSFSQKNQENPQTPTFVDENKNISEYDESVCQIVFTCKKTGKPYKISKEELRFLQKMKLPLSLYAPIQRINDIINYWANNSKLIKRQSSETGEELFTPYTAQDVPVILTKKEWIEKYQ